LEPHCCYLGRTDEQKQSVALILRENLTAYPMSVTPVSIDIRDMNPTAYKKPVLSQPGA
jgi:5-carboxymethyl-2-hydroxymuconate isomerase